MMRSQELDWIRNVETIVEWSPYSSEADLLLQVIIIHLTPKNDLTHKKSPFVAHFISLVLFYFTLSNGNSTVALGLSNVPMECFIKYCTI